MEILIAYICLKINENGLLCCVISSFFKDIFILISSEKCNIKKKRGGALNGKNMVMIIFALLHVALLHVALLHEVKKFFLG